MALFVAFICMFSGILTNVHAQSNFKDVGDGHWAAKEIQLLTGKRIIQGYKDGTFKPNQNLTRMQIALMVTRAKNYNLTNRPDPKLKDVKKGRANFDIISAVMAEGIFKDVVKNNEFKPNAFVTRAEMASILSRAYELTGTSTFQFKDITTNHWAYPYVQAVVKNQVANGYTDGTFKPDTLLTRAQFSVMMAKALNTVNPSTPAKPSEPAGKVYPDGWTAPVLRTEWTTSDYAHNIGLFNRELGFVNNAWHVPGQQRTIVVGNNFAGYEADIAFSIWENDDIATSYRVPVIAEELFEFYFGEDANRVLGYFNRKNIPQEFTAGGRKVDVFFSGGDGTLILKVGHKQEGTEKR